MKNNKLSVSLLAVLALCACENNRLEVPVLESKTLTATIEDGFSSDTKTSLDESGNVLWKQGDKISAFLASTINQQYQVTDDSDGKTSATLNPVSSGLVAGTEIENNVAFYPYASTASIAKNSGSYVISNITLPATQNFAQNSFGNGAFPMAAVTSSTSDMNLKFKNIVGGLKLQLNGTASIASISVTGNNNEILCGAANVTVSTSNVPSINLTDASAKTVTLDCGTGVALNTSTATSFIVALPPMTMTGGFTVIVTDTEGKQMEIKTTKSQTITRSGLLKMPAVNYEGTVKIPNGYVDLGLSVFWATCNLGATVPEEYGNYYAWGETQPKSEYRWDNYKYGSNVALTKYTVLNSSGTTRAADGQTDGKKILESVDDAATAIFGEKYRMPTNSEVYELINNTTRTLTQIGGVYGYKLQSKKAGYTENWIFIPSAGYKNGTSLITEDQYGSHYRYAICWAKDLDKSYDFCAYQLELFYTGDYPSLALDASDSRHLGHTIRPICEKNTNSGITGISLDRTSISSIVGLSEQLTATLSKTEGAVNHQTEIEWFTSNPSIVSVDYNGKITAKAPGTATITAKAPFGGFTASCTVAVEAYTASLSYIDLGLSVKWANMNLGSSSIEGFGDYFAWGATEPYYEDGYAQEDPQQHWKSGKSEGYGWSSYKYTANYSYDSGDGGNFTKYCSKSSYGKNGYTDNKTVLEATDDAATVILGNTWRIPTQGEMAELLSDCNWIPATFNNVQGFKVEGKTSGYTDKWIFIPYGSKYRSSTYLSFGSYYWTSSLSTDSPNKSYYLWIGSYVSSVKIETNKRSYGYTIRPIHN